MKKLEKEQIKEIFTKVIIWIKENKKLSSILIGLIGFILILGIIKLGIFTERKIEEHKSTKGTIHGIIVNDNITFDTIGENLTLNKGDNAYIYKEYEKNGKKYAKIKSNGRIGEILAQDVYYYEKSENQEYSLMCDVSSFNKDTFKNENDFEYFLLKNKIQYVYIRMRRKRIW